MLVSACLVTGGIASAQESGAGEPSGYRVGESGSAPPASHPTERVARFEYVSGKVTWRVNSGSEWASAKKNQSLRQGDKVWVTDGGRAEIRFDDGTLLRLGNGAIVTLQTLYSDAQGNYTQVKMQSGLLTLRLRSERAVYEVDTSVASVKATGLGRVRVGAGDAFEVSVRSGQAKVESSAGKTTVNSGEYLLLNEATKSYRIQSLPPKDSWETWNDDRDLLLVVLPPTRTVYYPAPSPRIGLYFSLDLFGGSYRHRGWSGRAAGHYHR